MAASKTSEEEAREYAESIINTVREPLIVLDQDLRVISASRSFYEVFKIKPEETLGRLIYDLGNKQWDIPELRQLLETLLPQKTTLDDYELEHEFADLGRRTMLLNAREVKRKSGKERLILLAIEDITERKKAEEELKNKERYLRKILESQSELVVIVDLENRFKYLNDAYCKQFGKPREELLGKSFTPLVHEEDIEDTLKAMEGVYEPPYRISVEQRTKTVDGWRWIAWENSAILDEQGHVLEILGVGRDITERKQYEEAWRQSEEKYRRIFEHSPEAIVMLDTQGTVLDVNERLEDWLGYKPDEVRGKNLWQLPYLPQQSKNELKTRFAKRMKVAKVSPYELEFISRNHERRTGLVHATPLADTEGNVNAYLVLISDITERKRTEEALIRSETKFRTLYDTTTDAVMLLDENGFFDCNKATLSIFGFRSREEFYSKSPADLSPLEQPDGTNSLALANQMFLTAIEKGSLHFEWMHKRKDTGETFPADVLFTAIELDGKSLVQAVVRDITERKQAEEKIQQIASHDSLTGLPNRNLFSDRLGIALAHAHRNQYDVAVIMLDLDDFKDVNDTLGHDAGDLLLKAATERLSATLRQSDTVARFGGDEFVLILPDVKGEKDVGQLAQRIVNSFHKHFLIGNRQFLVTTSIGLAVFPHDGTDETTLLKNADIAMYQAKQAGGDRYQVFSKNNDSYS